MTEPGASEGAVSGRCCDHTLLDHVNQSTHKSSVNDGWCMTVIQSLSASSIYHDP